MPLLGGHYPVDLYPFGIFTGVPGNRHHHLPDSFWFSGSSILLSHGLSNGCKPPLIRNDHCHDQYHGYFNAFSLCFCPAYLINHLKVLLAIFKEKKFDKSQLHHYNKIITASCWERPGAFPKIFLLISFIISVLLLIVQRLSCRQQQETVTPNIFP